MKNHSKALKNMGLALAGISAVISGSALAEMQIQTQGGLKVSDPANPHYSFKLNGRLELDEVLFSGAARDRGGNFPSSGNIRRAFVAFGGGVGENLTYNLGLDFGRAHSTWTPNAATNASTATLNTASHGHTVVEEAWLGYTGFADKATRVRVGQFTPLATMDGAGNYGTDNSQMFLESALATSTFSVPSYSDYSTRSMKGFGVVLDTHFCDMLTLAATVYQPAHGSANVNGNAKRSDRLGQAVRVTFSPVHDESSSIHLGALVRHQSLNHTDSSQAVGSAARSIRNTLFFTTPEAMSRNYVGNPRDLSAVTTNDPNVINAGAIRAKGYNHFAGELAGIWGPVSVQGEYHHAIVKRLAHLTDAAPTNGKSLKFHGWHAQAGYVLTGESRAYDFARGTIGGIKPSDPSGAWELVARYSYVTLNNKEIFGGSGHNATAGANWYVNNNIRLAFNYIRSNIRPTGVVAGTAAPANGVKRKLDILAARVQVVF
jgi:phosphate-selective porin OprO/OprP